MERSFAAEVELLKLGAGRTFHGEGILAVTKALLQSGVSYVGGYQGAPVSHMMDVLDRCARHHGRAGHPRRDQRVRSRCGGDAGRLDQLPDARRGDLEIDRRHQRRLGCAVQPRLGGSQGRRAHRHRRGLRRGRLDHPGALPRLRHEVADVAARSAAEPADHRPHGREGLRALRGLQHPGVPGAAHPRLSRAWQLRGQGQQGAARSRASTCWTIPTSTTAASACRPRPTRRRSTRSRCAGRLRSASSASTSSTNSSPGPAHRRRRHHLPGRPVQRRPCARCSSSGSPTPSAKPGSRSTASTSPIRSSPRRSCSSAPASARCWWSRKGSRPTSRTRCSPCCAARAGCGQLPDPSS